MSFSRAESEPGNMRGEKEGGETFRSLPERKGNAFRSLPGSIFWRQGPPLLPLAYPCHCDCDCDCDYGSECEYVWVSESVWESELGKITRQQQEAATTNPSREAQVEFFYYYFIWGIDDSSPFAFWETKAYSRVDSCFTFSRRNPTSYRLFPSPSFELAVIFLCLFVDPCIVKSCQSVAHAIREDALSPLDNIHPSIAPETEWIPGHHLTSHTKPDWVKTVCFSPPFPFWWAHFLSFVFCLFVCMFVYLFDSCCCCCAPALVEGEVEMCECKYAAIRGAHDKITRWQPIMYAQCFHKTGRIEEVHWPLYLAYLCLNSVFELDSGTRQDSKLGGLERRVRPIRLLSLEFRGQRVSVSVSVSVWVSVSEERRVSVLVFAPYHSHPKTKKMKYNGFPGFTKREKANSLLTVV